MTALVCQVDRICNGVESVSPSSDLQWRRDWVAGEDGFDGEEGMSMFL